MDKRNGVGRRLRRLLQPSLSTCTTSGEPWPLTNVGTGHLWPVLSGERGEYDIATFDRSDAERATDGDREDDVGPLPGARAGVGERGAAGLPVRVDPTTASIGFENGQPVGSASRSRGRRRRTRGWRSTLARATTSKPRGSSPTATSPTGCPAASGDDHVADRRRDHRQRHRGRDRHDYGGGKGRRGGCPVPGGAAAIASTTADGSGSWSLTLPVSFGSARSR